MASSLNNELNKSLACVYICVRVVFSLTFWKLEYSREIIGDRDLGISLKTWAQFPEEHAISIPTPYSHGVFWEGFHYFHSSPESVQTCAHARAVWVKLRLQRTVRWSKRKFGGYSLTWKLLTTGYGSPDQKQVLLVTLTNCDSEVCHPTLRSSLYPPSTSIRSALCLGWLMFATFT